MRVLLDTHVWLWWLLGSERLHASERRALDQLAASGHTCLAAMRLWEAQMLQAKGRLIVATAAVHELPLASHDQTIRASGVVPIWESRR